MHGFAYVFRIIRIVVYDMGGCHVSVVIDPGYVNCFCGCVMDFCDVFRVFLG